MGRRCWSLALLSLLGAIFPVLADGLSSQRGDAQTSVQPPALELAVGLQEPSVQGQDKAANDKESANGNGAAKEEPEHIKDNAMLVEEAFNQEPGVVQHIFNWINEWERLPQGHRRDFSFVYTMELPLGSQAHQFSFTIPFLTEFEHVRGSPAQQQGDIGDIFLNYRYQLLSQPDWYVWAAPRFSLLLPTGDERFGLGTGELGYIFNLPISKQTDLFDFHFNAGFTYIPHVSLPLGNGLSSPSHDLRGYNLGASAYWKPKTNLHFFVEALALWNEQIDDLGFRDHTTEVFVNPGVRYAICQLDAVEWVIGVAAPIGLTSDAPDYSIFAYMSVEHKFRKGKNDKKE